MEMSTVLQNRFQTGIAAPLVGLLLLLTPQIGAAVPSNSRSASAEPNTPKPGISIPGDEINGQPGRPADYGWARAEIKQICELLREDGRSDLLASLLEPRLKKDAACSDCRPLFMQIYGPCRPPVEKKSKAKKKNSKKIQKEIEEPTNPDSAEKISSDATVQIKLAVPPQRFPQLALLDSVSDLSRKLAEPKVNSKSTAGADSQQSQANEQTRQAVVMLTKILAPAPSSAGTTILPGARNYFEIFNAFLMSAFESENYVAPQNKVKPSTKGLFSEEEDVEKQEPDINQGFR